MVVVAHPWSRGAVSGAELGDPTEREGGTASGVPTETSGTAAHPKTQLPEGHRPLSSMVA